MKKWLLYFGFLFLVPFWITGCTQVKSNPEVPGAEYPEPEKKGIYHKVSTGQTLWRIAKVYGVSIAEITRANNIPNVAKLEKNQLIFIPRVESVKEVLVPKDDSENDFVWPYKGKVLHYFHERIGSQVNKGIDIAADEGETIVAARSGRVVFADFLTGYGYVVILDHDDDYHTVYAQNSHLKVKLGEAVAKFAPIALVGKNSKESFVHFEVRKNAIEDNPLYYLP